MMYNTHIIYKKICLILLSLTSMMYFLTFPSKGESFDGKKIHNVYTIQKKKPTIGGSK